MTAAGLAEAYSQSAAAWARGPSRVYDRLAEVVVRCTPVPLAGRVVLDAGAGRGAASRAIARADGHPVAADLAFGMLAADPRAAPSVVADLRALPFPDGAFGGVVAAFSLNHVPDPARGVRETARVIAPGGPLVAAVYAEDDTHPVKDAVEQALTEVGWSPSDWYDEVRADAVPQMATPERAARVAVDAGLASVEVQAVAVEFPELDGRDLVAWRCGMAHHAPFVDALDVAGRARVEARALDLLGDPPALRRSIVVLTAIV